MEFRKVEKQENSFDRIILNLPPEPDLAIPLLRCFASPPGTILSQRLERRYRRLCFVQDELGRLNSHSKADTISFEDFVFSKMDFSRYQKIPEEDFGFYPESIADFGDGFFTKNFKLDCAGVKSTIEKNYKKVGPFFCLLHGNALILSIMHTLETSLESLPLVREEEIIDELNDLFDFMKAKMDGGELAVSPPSGEKKVMFSPKNIDPFFEFLLDRLDGLNITQSDGNQTKLFLNPEGRLSGTFMPRNKPWTITLEPRASH